MTTKYIPLLAIGLLLASCGHNQQSQQIKMQAASVPVIQIPTRNITGQTTYPTSIEGIINAEVHAKISGYITQVLVDEGDYVHKGQLMFRLETHALSEDAKSAKANVDAAQVGVDQLKPLVKKNIISSVQLETAKAKLAQAKAAYKSIMANIGYANIKSPIDGVVGAINYRQGSLVNPNSPLPLTTVSKTNQVYAYFSMNEADYLDFLQRTPGKTLNEKISHFPKVSLKMANGEIYKNKGNIRAVTAQVDPQTGTVSFRATFPNPDHLIANGSSGSILIPKVYKDALLVPVASTYEQQGKVYIYQVLKDSTVTPAIITITDNINGLYVVSSGVQKGEQIVSVGAGTLHDKEKIQPVLKQFDSVANIEPVFQ